MNTLKKYILQYKVKKKKRDADEYYDAMVSHCKYLSRDNNYFAFIITRKGYYGKPIIRQIDNHSTVCFYEGDTHIIIKNGLIYSLQEKK